VLQALPVRFQQSRDRMTPAKANVHQTLVSVWLSTDTTVFTGGHDADDVGVDEPPDPCLAFLESTPPSGRTHLHRAPRRQPRES
jgi:hypothetical protein